MKGNEILLSADPRGVFKEGVIDDASLPGTCMEIVPGTEMTGGRHHWRASSVTTGSPRNIAVLLEDRLQGKLATDAYVAGTRGFLYCPLPGEELNMLVLDVSGTTDSHAIGDLLGVTNTGLLETNNTYTSTPFTCMETVAHGTETGNTLVFCMKN